MAIMALRLPADSDSPIQFKRAKTNSRPRVIRETLCIIGIIRVIGLTNIRRVIGLVRFIRVIRLIGAIRITWILGILGC